MYLNMELALPRSGCKVELGCVNKRLRDKDGLPIGTAHDIPILDFRVYEVEFPDGPKASLSANTIAENLFAEVDDKGKRHVLVDEVITHRTNGKEVRMQDAFAVSRYETTERDDSRMGAAD
jgi:hypothetical protein